ncbi:LEAF RUST 10 DISEASE-RESISTANCE LOCUS RECEPTOR-LIKE PROTEIN KINASE-like 2.7, partial [Mucuna pruriens]
MPISLCSLFALSIIILVTCHAESSNTSATCAPSNCGNISIRYPFWNKSNTTNTKEFCGYPDFGLECVGNHAIITLPSDKYYVTDINYDNHSITLVDIDVLDQSCPRARHNVSIHNLPFSFSQQDLNLSFYFNCSSHPSSVDSIGCMKNEMNQSYVFMAGDEAENGNEWLKQCEEHVVVIVKQDEIEISDLIPGFGDAMKKGFVLDWMQAGDCAVCEESHGNCGFDLTTKQSRCLCTDGRNVAKSCKKGTLISIMPSPSSLINTLFFFSLFFPTYLSSDIEGYTACEPFICGNFSNISYPFWSVDQRDYCGHPMFKLDCQQDNVTIDIMSQKFHVIDLNQSSKVLKIARLDLWADPCTNEYVNVNLDSGFFNYTSSDDNYTLLYDCDPVSYTPPPSLNLDASISFTCPTDGGKDGFFVLSSDVVNFKVLGCKNSIAVPVLRVAVKDALAVQNVLEEGFEVGWRGVDEGQCDGCKQDGGRCGHNASMDAFICFCPNQQSNGGGFCSKSLAESPLPAPAPRPTPEKGLLPPPYSPKYQQQSPPAPSILLDINPILYRMKMVRTNIINYDDCSSDFANASLISLSSNIYCAQHHHFLQLAGPEQENKN